MIRLLAIVYQMHNLDVSRRNDTELILSKKSSPTTAPNQRFVEFVGLPPPDSQTRIGPSDSISPSPDPYKIIDVLDPFEEEPFTLETFHGLIFLHHSKSLDFIIARVRTKDPKDENRDYYSYYSAHHINKVLFQTDVNAGLLHRLNSKNPLNNIDIVGDVHYYCIQASSEIGALSKATALDNGNNNGSNVRRMSFDDAYTDQKLVKNTDSTHLKTRSSTYANDQTGLSVEEWIQKQLAESPTHIVLQSPTKTTSSSSPRKRHTKISISQSPTSNYKAHYLGSDDDYLMHRSLRSYFTANGLDANEGLLFDRHTSSSPISTLRNLLVLIREQNHSQSTTNWKKVVKISIPAYMLVSFIILKFLVPLNLIYVVAIILIVLFCGLVMYATH